MPDPKLPPHPAKVGPARSAQPAIGRARPPHPATLQRHERPGALPPHPATVQRKAAQPAMPAKLPHPASLQRHERPGALPPHPATVQRKVKHPQGDGAGGVAPQRRMVQRMLGAPAIAVPPYVENQMDWETSAAAATVRQARLDMANEWLQTLTVNQNKYEDRRDAIAAAGEPTALFMRNFASVELQTGAGATYVGVAASAGGSPGLHAERQAFHHALTAALGNFTWQTLDKSASQLWTDHNIFIARIYTDRELCKVANSGSDCCANWLKHRAGGNNTACQVGYGYLYNAWGKKLMRDEILTYLRGAVDDSDLLKDVLSLWKDRVYG